MAIYDYECNTCKQVTEIVHGMSETPELECSCGSSDIVKVILQAPGVVVPPNMQAVGSKCAYYGIKNLATGEGINKLQKGWADSGKPGIRVKKTK
jgi:putative FmdB family regulatory protein